MNSVTISGRLGHTPELKETKNGNEYTLVSIATTGWKGQAEWIDCIAWGKYAKALAEKTRKGDKILVTGKLAVSTYSKDGKQVKQQRVNILGFTSFALGKRDKAEMTDVQTADFVADII